MNPNSCVVNVHEEIANALRAENERMKEQIGDHQRALLAALSERDAMLKNLDSTQARCTRLLEENRRLKQQQKAFGASDAFSDAQELVYAERERQNAKWQRTFGVWDLAPDAKLRVLVEEVGEVARAINDCESIERLRAEITEVAAVAIAWLETMVPK